MSSGQEIDDLGVLKFTDYCWDSTEDGKEMSLDTEKLGFNDIMEEVDRHSRMLARKQELAG